MIKSRQHCPVKLTNHSAVAGGVAFAQQNRKIVEQNLGVTGVDFLGFSLEQGQIFSSDRDSRP